MCFLVGWQGALRYIAPNFFYTPISLPEPLPSGVVGGVAPPSAAKLDLHWLEGFVKFPAKNTAIAIAPVSSNSWRALCFWLSGSILFLINYLNYTAKIIAIAMISVVVL